MPIFDVTSPHFYIAIGLSLINAVLMLFVSAKFLQIIQLSGYNLKGYNEWLKDTKCKYVSRCAMLSFLCLSSMIVVNSFLDFYTPHKLYSYLGLIFYFILTIVFIKFIYDAPKKTPLKQTRRMNRLMTLIFFITAIFTYGLFIAFYSFDNFIRFAIIGIVPVFMPIIVPFAHILMKPLEELNKKRYVKKAKKELLKHTSLIKIGITGSYGKTSTKFILNQILSKKYKVCMSPNSFNTPMGLTKVILKYLKPDDEILIAEMGAKKEKEIQELCDLIKPDFGIITAVGPQHLETFKTIENIAKTKNELAENIDDKNLVVYNKDNEYCNKLYEERKGEKQRVSLKEEADVFATDLVVTSNGSKFTLNIDNKQVQMETKLVGKHNILNILFACSLGYKLNVSLEDIKDAVYNLQPIPHRLELRKENNITILDNSYNSSVDGTKASLETLNLFKGRKIVVTPGLVELGSALEEENKNFGARMAKIADIVVIVNVFNREAIKSGLLEEKFKEENIYLVNNLTEVLALFKTLIKDGDIVLLENDLPDSYT